jgi:hypothetical protein
VRGRGKQLGVTRVRRFRFARLRKRPRHRARRLPVVRSGSTGGPRSDTRFSPRNAQLAQR